MSIRTVLLGALLVLSTACSGGRHSAILDDSTTEITEESRQLFEEKLREGDEAWAERDNVGAVRRAVAAYEEAVAANPHDGDAWTKLARAYYFLSDGHIRDIENPEFLPNFEKGVAAAERAMAQLDPSFREQVANGVAEEEAVKTLSKEAAMAAYWYASNLGKWAKAKGLPAQLGNKNKILNTMERLKELDGTLFYAGPYRYFGAAFAVAPAFAGGDMKKSKEHFEKSLEMEPRYVGTKVLMADVYAVKTQDRALFKKLLDEVLATPDDVIPELTAETKAEKAKARDLLAKIDDLF